MDRVRRRFHPLWWPALAALSPVLGVVLGLEYRRFLRDRLRAEALNRQRLDRARPLELPALEFVDLTVLVEWKTEEGFLGDAGVSYLFRTDRGALLFDIGFGPARPALAHNALRLGFSLDEVDAVAISHLHPDHMGGVRALRSGQVQLPPELRPAKEIPCFLPDRAGADGLAAEVVTEPRLLAAGIASTGPLARSLFLLGLTEEQALVANLRGKGLVVFTGCGHPTVGAVLSMVRRLSDLPIHAFGGGMHFPITEGRGSRAGIEIQMLMGTGQPPWRRLTDEDLSATIAILNDARPARLLPSGHDSCDHALSRLASEVKAETTVLKAGATYRL